MLFDQSHLFLHGYVYAQFKIIELFSLLLSLTNHMIATYYCCPRGSCF